MTFASVGKPEDGFGGGTVPRQDEVTRGATGNGPVALLGDRPAGAPEALQRIVDRVTVPGAVDDLQDDAVGADLIDALD